MHISTDSPIRFKEVQTDSESVESYLFNRFGSPLAFKIGSPSNLNLSKPIQVFFRLDSARITVPQVHSTWIAVSPGADAALLWAMRKSLLPSPDLSIEGWAPLE